MRVNSITNPYVTPNNFTIKNSALKKQTQEEDVFTKSNQNPSFQGEVKLGIYKRYQISKYFTDNIPFDATNFKQYINFVRDYSFSTTGRQAKKLFDKAKKTIMTNNPTSSNALYALDVLLYQADRTELKDLEKDKLNSTLTEYVNKLKELGDNRTIAKIIDLLLDANPQLDVNELKIGNEPVIFACFRYGNIEALQHLAKRDDVNWNIVNSKDNNILLQNFIDNDRYDIIEEDSYNLLRFLQNLPEDKFNINYINSDGINALKKACSNSMKYAYIIPELLKFPNLDVNIKNSNGEPIYVNLIDDTNWVICRQLAETLKTFLTHPNFDDKTLMPNLIMAKVGHFSYDELREEWYKMLSELFDNKSRQKIKKLYNENGIFSLEQMEDIVNYPDLRSVVNARLNDFGERLVHLISDIPLKENDSQTADRLKNILDKMKQADCYFRAQDDFGRTALEKAKEGENKTLVKLLQEYFRN